MNKSHIVLLIINSANSVSFADAIGSISDQVNSQVVRSTTSAIDHNVSSRSLVSQTNRYPTTGQLFSDEKASNISDRKEMKKNESSYYSYPVLNGFGR